MNLTAFDVVVVPFPYSDKLAEKRRPALVVSAPDLGSRLGRVWVAMITSTRGPSLHGDAEIGDLQAAGLPSASTLRASKVTTIDLERILRRAGRLSADDEHAARVALRHCAGF